MDDTDRRLVNALLDGFPVQERPFAPVAQQLGLEEAEVIRRLARLRAEGVLTRFGPLYDTERLGGAVTLCAMQVPAERFEKVAKIVNTFPEVAHNYERRHALNMWFVLAVERPEQIDATVARIEAATGLEVLNLPKLDEYFLELKLTA
jgi:DNA-binding Lrp family transcriptional regulator